MLDQISSWCNIGTFKHESAEKTKRLRSRRLSIVVIIGMLLHTVFPCPSYCSPRVWESKRSSNGPVSTMSCSKLGKGVWMETLLDIRASEFQNVVTLLVKYSGKCTSHITPRKSLHSWTRHQMMIHNVVVVRIVEYYLIHVWEESLLQTKWQA